MAAVRVALIALAAVVAAGEAHARRWPRAASWAAGDAAAASAPGDLQLLLLHTNDMHARFEETDRNSSACTPALKAKGECYGGFARLAHALREAKEAARNGSGPPALFLNAGDTYQGTVWYTIHKWRIVNAMLSKLAPDAMSLGNHEFDDGLQGLLPFLEIYKLPVLAANLNWSAEPRLARTSLRASTEFTIKEWRVGVIGYLTPETRNISFPPNSVVFEDEVVALQREARRLTKHGVSIIIALGHSGFDVDQRIAEMVPEVDVVIGGHTNTFLYSGSPPDIEKPDALYPMVVTQKSGKRVPVVQAYAYTKYLGRLTVTFDAAGNLKAYHGNPQLMNASIPEAQDVLDELGTWRATVMGTTAAVAGRSTVFLEGSARVCRTRECNLGNLIADAFVEYNVRRLPPSGQHWTDAAVALQHSGGIRASLDAASRGGNVTEGDIMTTLPFENRMFRCELTGSQLRQTLEWSVSRYDPQRVVNPGAFLQVAGLRIVYDVSRPEGKRLRSVMVRCARCRVPEFQPLDENDTYGVLIPQFIKQGGDGYHVLETLPEDRCQLYDYTDLKVVTEYFNLRSPVTSSLDDRISFDPAVEMVARELSKLKSSATSFTSFISSYIGVFVVFIFVWN